VYNDTPSNRQKFEDQYSQTFYISNADPQELVAILNQMVSTGPAIRPIIFQNKSANAIVVRATAPVLDVIGRIIEANDQPRPEVNYQSGGVNLLFTARVTYKDEIILESLTLENSALGINLDVGGQTFPTLQRRSAQGSIRLRDGESNMIAGLLRDQDRKALKS